MIAPKNGEECAGSATRRLTQEAAVLEQLRVWDRACQRIEADLSVIRRKIEAQLDAFQRLLPDPDANPVSVIIDLCAAEFGVGYDAILGRGRNAQVAQARHVAMAISRQIIQCPLVALAKQFSRHHGAVIFGCQQVQNLADVDPAFRRRFDRLRSLAKAALRKPNHNPKSK